MVLINDVYNIRYNNKEYTILKLPFKHTTVPIILDKNIYDKIKNSNRSWNISNNGSVYTNIDGKLLYLHEIVYLINNKKAHLLPIIHINKIPLDNRIENLMEDKQNKEIKKNLNKKSRTIILKDIDVDKIPSFIWYMKDDGDHGERFQIKLGSINWKCTSCDKLSLKYKLEETKKYLRQYKEKNKREFLENSMNSDLNENGIKLKREFYEILKKNNMNYLYNIENNTDILLRENTSGLNKIEKKLLEEFNIDNNISTYNRYLEIRDIYK
jgi:hypothetical protein